ncbi:MAG: plasmid pRiA4b ORF-3 family protein, partial [Gammaproteobacteria bacterium]|nr:plasmid pRiA4b ORF-3 family protein [Gammaproteobacteria bacterium]
MPLEHYGHGLWGTHTTPTFWFWLKSQNPQPGGHVLLRVIEGEEGWYTVTLEARVDRDEAGILQQNLALIALGQKMMKRPYGAMDRDITTNALATGFYQHDVPPDPFGELWTAITQLDEEMPKQMQPEDTPDPLVSALFERPAQVYNPEAPPSLPREYDPQYGRRHARPSLKARKGSVKSWIFRINHRADPDVWTDIELAEDQTLEDLHLQIQSAFRWMDDHLYS